MCTIRTTLPAQAEWYAAANYMFNKTQHYLVLCCAALRCAVLCCAVLCCAVLCCAVLCCAVLCCAVLCCAVLCCAVLCCAVLCCAALRCAALRCAVLRCAVLCCAVLCCAVLCVLCCNVLNHGRARAAAIHEATDRCISESECIQQIMCCQAPSPPSDIHAHVCLANSVSVELTLLDAVLR